MHAVLDAVVRRISREIQGLDVETAQANPNENPHHWSSQEVIEHLALTCRATTRSLEARLAKGHVLRNRKHSAVQWILRLMVLSFGYFPQGVPALDETVPVPGCFRRMDGEELGDLLKRELEAMDAVLDRCRQKFGMERVEAHPILGPLRVDQWRRYHVVHCGHHLKQLERLHHVEPCVIADRTLNVRLAKEMQVPAQRSLT